MSGRFPDQRAKLLSPAATELGQAYGVPSQLAVCGYRRKQRSLNGSSRGQWTLSHSRSVVGSRLRAVCFLVYLLISVRVQVRFELPLHAPRNWCNRTVYMFAVVQLLACYIVVALGLLFLAVVVVGQRDRVSDEDARRCHLANTMD